MKKVGIALITLLLALILAPPAGAVVLGIGWGIGISPVTVNYHGSNEGLWAGALNGYLGGTLGNPLPPSDGTFIGRIFCVDLDHFISVPTEYNVDALTTASLNNGARAAWLYNTYAPALASGSDAAALQVALWDVVYDSGDGLAAGTFKYVSGLGTTASSQAQSMITASEEQSSSARFFRPTGTYGQAMIGPPSPVPEPTTLGFLGLGLVGAALIQSMRRRA